MEGENRETEGQGERKDRGRENERKKGGNDEWEGEKGKFFPAVEVT